MDPDWQDRFELCSPWQRTGHSHYAMAVERQTGRPVWIEIIPFAPDSDPGGRFVASLEALRSHFVPKLAHVIDCQYGQQSITIATERIEPAGAVRVSYEQFLDRAILLAEACLALCRLGLSPASSESSAVVAVDSGWALQLCPFPSFLPGGNAAHLWGQFGARFLRSSAADQLSPERQQRPAKPVTPPELPAELEWLLCQSGVTIDELANSLREIRFQPHEPGGAAEVSSHSPRTYLILAGIMLVLLTIWLLMIMGSH